MLDRFPFVRLAGLKKLARGEEGLVSETPTSARVVCVASGKGGTGKSVIATNLAVLRSRRGSGCCSSISTPASPARTFCSAFAPLRPGHVLEGKSTPRALVDGPHGMKLLSGGVGRQTLVNPTRRELDRLFKALRPLEDRFDLVIVDHGAGLSYSTVAHLAATSTLLLVTNHEVTALSDAYAIYKRANALNPHVRRASS
jgi:flagellar biosynthesis protein FlhG